MPSIGPIERILLFDIDGVLVSECKDRNNGHRALFKLHTDPAGILDSLCLPYGFLTHRSRHEAQRIIAALGIHPGKATILVCANDMVGEALRSGKLLSLLSRGILKNYAIPLVCRRLKLRPESIAVIDDLQINLDRLNEEHVGLLIKAPGSNLVGSKEAISFDPSELSACIESWVTGTMNQRIVLKERQLILNDSIKIPQSSFSTGCAGFKFLRSMGRFMRKLYLYWV